MISGVASIPFAIACVVFFLLSGGLGFAVGWLYRGWQNIKLNSAQRQALSEVRAELAKTSTALADKTRDLNTLKTVSRAETDRLQSLVENQPTRPNVAADNPPERADEGGGGDCDQGEPDSHPLDERRQDTRRQDEKTAKEMAEIVVASEAAARKTGGYTEQFIEEGGSTTDFFNTDFSTDLPHGEFFKPAEGFSADKEQLQNQERVIVKLVEKSRKLEAEVEKLTETNKDLLLAASTRLKSADESEGTTTVNKVAILVGQMKNAQALLLSREQELDKLEQKTANQSIRITTLTQELEASKKIGDQNEKQRTQVAQLEGQLQNAELLSDELNVQKNKVSQLVRKLHETDKMNASLQAATSELPLLKAQLAKAECALDQQHQLTAELSRVTENLFKSEQQSVALQENNAALHTQITALKQESSGFLIRAEQQEAARQLFEKDAIAVKQSLARETERCQSLSDTIDQYANKIKTLEESIARLSEESNDHQTYAAQLDTLNIQLNNDLKIQIESTRVASETAAEFEQKLQSSKKALEEQQTRNMTLQKAHLEQDHLLAEKHEVIARLQHKIEDYRRVDKEQHGIVRELKAQIRGGEHRALVWQNQIADLENRIATDTQRQVEFHTRLAELDQLNVALKKQKSELAIRISRLEAQTANQLLKIERLQQISTELDKRAQESQDLYEQKLALAALLANRVTSLSQLAVNGLAVSADKVRPQQQPSEHPGNESVPPDLSKKAASQCKRKAKPKAAVRNTVTSLKSVRSNKHQRAHDDLKLIHGVGPKLEKLLVEYGYTTFEQIAELDRSGINALESCLGKFGNRIRRDNWVKSAKKLAKLKTDKAA